MNRKFKTLISLGLCILMIIACVPSSFAVEPSAASSGPIITASVSESKYEIAANFFCVQPTIKVAAEAGLKKVTVSVKVYSYEAHDYVTTELPEYSKTAFDFSDYSFKIGDRDNGLFVVRAEDQNGSVSEVTFNIGHIMGSRSSTFLPPTCEKAGYSSYTQTCRYCKEQYYKVETPIETAKPLGHLYKMEGDSEVPSNTADDPCEVDSSADGTLNQYICRRCGQIKNVITDGAEYEESKHTWGTYTGELNQTASGCNTPGLEFEECTKCHALRLKTYTAPPQQHNNTERNAVTPTCTRPSSVDLYCSKCNTFITTRITGGNTAHKYVPDQEYTLTCTQGYEGPATCSVCENHIDNYKINPLPHTFETVRVEPTCSAAGSSKQVCTVCKTVKEGSEKEIPKLKHIPEPDDYDCSTPVKCTICGETVVPAKEHDLVVNWTSVPDMPYHAKRCKNEGCRYEATENHYTARPDLACEYQTKCAACNVAMQPTGHTSTVTPVPVNVLNMSIYQVEPDPNGLYHAIICTTCHKVLDRRSLTVHSAVNKQDITDCTKALTCVCGKVYREAKPEHVFPEIPVKGTADSEYHEYDCVDPVCTQRKTAPHDYSYKVEIIPGKAATCTEEGYHHEVKECICGAKIDSVVTDPATGHDFGDLVQVAPTTCTANGSSYRRCNTCGYDEYETYDATGHVWEAEYTVDVEATCHSEGTESIHCSVCHIANPDMQKSIPKKDHTFTVEVTVSEPTCTDAGIKEYECSVCHERGNPEAIPAKGHEFEEWTCDQDSTCTTAGTQQRKCKNCTLIETRTCPDHPAKGHTWGEFVENNDATYDKNATKTRTCTVCGETETEEIPDSKLHQHFWGPYEYQNDATCFADGTEVAECQNCGTKSEPRTAVGTKLEHSFGVYEPDGNATCLEDGTETAVCVYCGIEKDTRTDEGSALGHSYGEYRYMEDATCLYDGHEASECLNGCGYVDIRIAAGTQLPHSFINYVYNDDATCEADGTETAICELCKTEKDTRTAEGTGGHIWSNPKFEWSDDYTSANVVYTCERDGGHSKPITAAVETVTIEATCETDGSKTAEAKAEVDGVTYIDSVILETYPAKGHNFVNNVCTVCGKVLHEHTPGEKYIFDGESHWTECTECGEAVGKEAHKMVNGVCSVCGYHVHTAAPDYHHDLETHWKVCTVCGEIMNRSSHSFTRRGYCTVCGFTIDLPKPTPNPTVIPETKSLVIDEVEVSEDIHSEVADVCGKILGVYYIGLGNTDYKPGDRVTVRVYAPGAKKDSMVLIRDEWEILKDAAMRIDGDYVEFTVDAGLIDKWHYFAIVDGFVSPTDVEVPQQAKYNAEAREIAG